MCDCYVIARSLTQTGSRAGRVAGRKSIVDMNVWGWARLVPTVLGDGAWEKFPNLKRLVDEVSARPPAQKAMALKDRHKFKTEMDAEAMQAMFPHLKVKVA
jgi:GST-like protein